MGSAVVLSNGELHVGLNDSGLVHDFYFPYVGLENHSAGSSLRHKIGVWVDGRISWLDDEDWEVTSRTADYALIGHTRAHNPTIGVIMEFDDVVDTGMSAFLRSVHVINDRSHERDIRVFFHQAFAIGDSRSNTDTAQYLPDSDAVLHYRGRRAFVIGGCSLPDEAPFDQHSVGLFGIEGREGTYRDADDGELECSAVEHGRVDSTIRFRNSIPPHDSVRLHYWIAAGTSTREALFVHKEIQSSGIDQHLHSSAAWWHDWSAPVRTAAQRLPARNRALFAHSALVVKAHTDKRGAIIASTDTTMLNYSRDAYGYCWPRDGAYALWPFIRLGYVSEPLRFFEFCKRVLHQNGYLMHKFQADGALGSSWHPYMHGELVAPPIQEDETALTLFMFAQFYGIQNDPKLLSDFYGPMVVKMADFMAGYVDDHTGLPRPSYDLWEEKFLSSTYTAAVTYAALLSAVGLAETMHDDDAAVRWRSAAEDIRAAAHKHFYDTERRLLVKGLDLSGEAIDHDTTLDLSTFFGAFMFGLYDLHSDEIRTTFERIKEVFGDISSSGLPRYENDTYHATSRSGAGNPWFITALWVAQYANEIDDRKLAETMANWVTDRVSSSGMLSEQLESGTDIPLSVSPLVWSHAEYMATMLDLYGGDSHA